MNSQHRFIAAALLLGIGFSCATPPGAPTLAQRAAASGHHDPIAVHGRWQGTFFQYDIGRAYPMTLTAEPVSPDSFDVTLDWPTLSQSQTRGQGAIQEGSFAWSEDELVFGNGIYLGGRYRAVLLDADTLVGVFDHDNASGGFFTLSRGVLR